MWLKIKTLEDFSLIDVSYGKDLLNIIKKVVSYRKKCLLVDKNMGYLNGSEAVKIIRNL
jgi:hypothetical protein